jgi:hypothetical protein
MLWMVYPTPAGYRCPSPFRIMLLPNHGYDRPVKAEIEVEHEPLMPLALRKQKSNLGKDKFPHQHAIFIVFPVISSLSIAPSNIEQMESRRSL